MRYRLFFKSSSKSSIVSLSTPAEPAFALTAFQASYTCSLGMTNGFDALTHLLLLPVGFEMQRLDPSPLLRRHYPSSSLVQDGPSQCSASDFSPRSFYYLSFYLGIGTTGSHSSTQEPESDCRVKDWRGADGLTSVRFQPLPIRTAREAFPQAAHPASFSERVMGLVDLRQPLSHEAQRAWEWVGFPIPV